MRLSPNSRLRDERGISMFLVIMAMFATSMMVAAAYAAANGDLPMSGDSRDRKPTYAAAEAGLNYYLSHLNEDTDYWTLCDNAPDPNATEPSPVNQAWDGTGTDPRQWRKVAGADAEYTIEMLPAPGSTTCDPTDQASLLDMQTGTFRVRVTGRPRYDDPAVDSARDLRRSIVATFRRAGFLDFIYFTDFETLDPQGYASSSWRDWAAVECADQYREARHSSCTEIQFITADLVKGPLHSNDSLRICGSPTFGRDENDSITTMQPAPGWFQACSSGEPNFQGVWRPGARKIEMPETNTQLRSVAQNDGLLYSGRTTIRLNGDSDTITVTNANVNGGNPVTVPTPDNGVIYVDNAGACNSGTNPPVIANYNESSACGNVYISGTYSSSMTIAAANDIIVRPPVGTDNGNVTEVDGSNSVLGLIANNFVRVYHRVNRDSSGNCQGNVDTSSHPLMEDVTIEAAILSLAHSFTVDNYSCGSALGTLTVTGAIAQKYRGPVGTGSGGSVSTGYAKDYTYDDRLRFRSPPYFLSPVDAAWSVVRSNEQVPAR